MPRLNTARVLGWALVTAVLAVLGIVVRFARSLVTPPRQLESELRILDIDRAHERIVLSDRPASRLPGNYGLWFGQDAGYLRFGEVISATPGRVVRELTEIVSGTPRRGQAARDTGWFFIAPWELDLKWENLVVPSELGDLPAWHFSPASKSDDWVIHVHGRTASRAETLRSVRVATDAGWHSLAVSYRNDRFAPRSTDGRYGLGSTEWQDVLAAIDVAVAAGAKRIVLFGWSMGGMISLRAAVEAQSTVPVGLILDSPALSWPDIISHHAELKHLPNVFGQAVTALLGSRWAPGVTGLARPIDWRGIDGGNLAARAELPVLLMHSAADDYVPVEPARQLAADLPALVEYHEFADAGHTRLWNRDPERWERTITEWLTRL